MCKLFGVTLYGSQKNACLTKTFPLFPLRLRSSTPSPLISDNLILPPIKRTLGNVGETKISINNDVAAH